MGSDPLLQLRGISLDPTEDGRVVVHRDPAVLQHQFEIAVADREHQIPAHGPQDHLGRELPALELFALRHATRTTACLVGTARLPNPDPPPAGLVGAARLPNRAPPHKFATEPKNPAYPAAVSAMKREGELWRFSRL